MFGKDSLVKLISIFKCGIYFSGSWRILFYMDILYLCRKVLCGFKGYFVLKQTPRGSIGNGAAEKFKKAWTNTNQHSQPDTAPFCQNPQDDTGACVEEGGIQGPGRNHQAPALPLGDGSTAFLLVPSSISSEQRRSLVAVSVGSRCPGSVTTV